MTGTRHRDDAPRGECQGCSDDALLTHNVPGVGRRCEDCGEGEGIRTHPRPPQPEYVRTMRGEHYLVDRDTDEVVRLDKRPTARELTRWQAEAAQAKGEAERRAADTAATETPPTIH